MVRGLFTSWTGMANEQKRLDIISNNLANATTVGYKKDNVTNQSFSDFLTLKVKDSSELYNDRPIGTMNLGVKLGEAYTDFSQGSLRETGNTYDLAIEGNGFFNIATTDADGNQVIRYTRNGTFTLDQNGRIVDADGNVLMGESGEITIPTNATDVSIDLDGSIYADGVYIDRIITTDFEDYSYLVKQDDRIYTAQDGAQAVEGTASIRQGFTEQSNVNVVNEMVEMITVSRAYEANQKVIQTIDGTLDLAANSVAKV
ncbi:MAG: Distal rod protein [Lachnoclostridium sp.]|jgi:flagellar basal-body rod protein FlgF